MLLFLGCGPWTLYVFWKHVCNHVFHIIFHQFIVSFVLQFIMIFLVIVFIWGLVEFGHHKSQVLKNLLWESVEILENHRYASDDRLFQATDVKNHRGNGRRQPTKNARRTAQDWETYPGAQFQRGFTSFGVSHPVSWYMYPWWLGPYVTLRPSSSRICLFHVIYFSLDPYRACMYEHWRKAWWVFP